MLEIARGPEHQKAIPARFEHYTNNKLPIVNAFMPVVDVAG